MIPRVTDAKYIREYTLYLSFSDGSDGEVDLEHELDGEILEPLKNITYLVLPELQSSQLIQAVAHGPI